MALLAQTAAPPATATPAVDDVLSPYMVVFFTAFAITFLVTPLMRWLALRNGIVDWPDLKRKTHIEPVPYLGGVAIFLGWLAGMFLCVFIVPGATFNGQALYHVSVPISIVLGAGLVMLVGLVDDVYGVSPRVKVGGQLLAAAALASNPMGQSLAYQSLTLVGIAQPAPLLCYVLGAAVIAIFVLGGCNSVNLLDGLDGLASGVVAIATVGFLFIAIYIMVYFTDPASGGRADQSVAIVRIVLCLATLGAVLGFLPYNFNPASIFMGDAGSLLLGYLSVTTMLLFAHVTNKGPFFVMAALIVFAVPITDTALALVRRKMRGQHLFSPDKQHIHHQLLAVMRSFGLSQNMAVKAAVALIYLLAILFALLGSAVIFLRWRYVMAVFMFIFGFVIVSAYKAGHRQLVLMQMDPAGAPATPAEAQGAATDDSSVGQTAPADRAPSSAPPPPAPPLHADTHLGAGGSV
ncbi:MAG: MraY family glycosyltransferase [Phycisphaeraceae bacterium]